MPENQRKKKFSIAKQILRYITLGLLTLLLIAAVYFQVPWRVISLLLIILLACTALPKPYRKWFWLSVGVVVIALVIWVFLPDDNEGWKPYTFDKELAAIEAERAIPDSENAATIYNQLLASYDANVFEPNFIKKEPWSTKDRPEMAEWLQKQESTIAMLMQASQKQNCRFPIDADIMKLARSMNRSAPMRQWAYLLISAANNDMAENRTDQALEKYTAVLQMAKHLYQQPTMIDMMVGIATEVLALKQLDRFIITGNASEEYLNSIEKAVVKTGYEWNSNWPKILESEKLLAKNFWAMYYEVNSKGKTRLSPNPMTSIRTRFSQETIPMPTYWQNKLIKASTILQWFFMLSTPQETAEVIDAAYQKYFAMADPNFNWHKPIQKFTPKFRCNYRHMIETMANILEEPYYKVHDIYLQSIADQRGCQIIIALRRYKNKNGAWPQSLDDIKNLTAAENLIDPLNNDSYVYRLTEENFTLYSKGKNNLDENGKSDRCSEKVTGADDLLIWPSRSSKTKEENKDVK